MTSVKKYLVYRKDTGECVNVVLWDEKSDFLLEDNLDKEIIPAGSSAWIGWIKNTDGEWKEPTE
jgi:hypothetical protein